MCNIVEAHIFILSVSFSPPPPTHSLHHHHNDRGELHFSFSRNAAISTVYSRRGVHPKHTVETPLIGIHRTAIPKAPLGRMKPLWEVKRVGGRAGPWSGLASWLANQKGNRSREKWGETQAHGGWGPRLPVGAGRAAPGGAGSRRCPARPRVPGRPQPVDTLAFGLCDISQLVGHLCRFIHL